MVLRRARTASLRPPGTPVPVVPLRASHAVVKEPASLLPHLAREEAERRHQYYLGPEHLLLGLLVEDENPAVRELRAHGMPVEVGDDNLTRLEDSFGLGREAYYDAAQNVRLRPIQPFPRAPGAGTPLICWRVFVLVREEAAARGEDATPLHWLLALLRDAEDPVEVTAHRYPIERRKRAMYGLPDHGPSPTRLLVEGHGLTLDQLRAATLEELDQTR